MASETRRLARAVYSYAATKTDELSFEEGDTINVKKSIEGGWWEGELNGNIGWFPSNYVEELPMDPPKPTPPAPPPKPTRSSSSAALLLGASTTSSQPSQPPVQPLSAIKAAQLKGVRTSGIPPAVMRNKHQSILAYQTLVGKEIVETERKYMQELDDFHDQFVVPLRESPLLSAEHKAHIFGNFDELFRFQRKFLRDLIAAVEADAETRRIGGFFLLSRPLFRQIYGRFASKHPKAVETINRYHDNAEVCALMESLGSKTKPPTLVLTQAWMKPSQRVKKYVALLKEAVRYTDDDHVDKSDLSHALTVYVELDAYLCEVRKRKEDELMIASSKIDGLEGSELESFGELSLMSYFMVPTKENGPLEERLLLLYAQFVVGLSKVTSKGKYDFKLREKLCLKDINVCAIDDVGNLSNAFEICTPKKTMRVSTHTASDREQWVAALQAHAKKAQNPTPLLEPLTTELKEEIVEADSKPKKKKFALKNLFNKDSSSQPVAQSQPLAHTQSLPLLSAPQQSASGVPRKSTDQGAPANNLSPVAPKRSTRAQTMDTKDIVNSAQQVGIGRANTLPLRAFGTQRDSQAAAAPVEHATDAYDVISQYGSMDTRSNGAAQPAPSSAPAEEPIYGNLPQPDHARVGRKSSMPGTLSAAAAAPVFRTRTNAASIHLTDEQAGQVLQPREADHAQLSRKGSGAARDMRRSPSFGDILGVVETLQKQVELLSQEVANLKISVENERSARESLERVVQQLQSQQPSATPRATPAPRPSVPARDR